MLLTLNGSSSESSAVVTVETCGQVLIEHRMAGKAPRGVSASCRSVRQRRILGNLQRYNRDRPSSSSHASAPKQRLKRCRGVIVHHHVVIAQNHLRLAQMSVPFVPICLRTLVPLSPSHHSDIQGGPYYYFRQVTVSTARKRHRYYYPTAVAKAR